MAMPSESDLVRVFLSNEPVSVIIRGHILLEKALTELIGQFLFRSHKLEMKRMSFSLKVDLAIGVGAIKLESRPLFLKLNNVRNRFAHVIDAVLDESTASELKSSLSEYHKWILNECKSPEKSYEILRDCLVAAFMELQAASEVRTEQLCRLQAILDVVADPIEKSEGANPSHPARIALEEKIRKRMEEIKVQGQNVEK